MPKKLLNKTDLKPLPKGFKRVLTKKNTKASSTNPSYDDVSTRT